MKRLGDLSAHFESSGDASTVSTGHGDSGGVSYGIYQLASNTGSIQNFVEWLSEQPAPYNEYGRQLAMAGDPCGDDSFKLKWEEIGNADQIGFGDLQDLYAQGVYYETGANRLVDTFGFDISNRSNALKQVLFSNCVQHGSHYGAEILNDAAILCGKDINSMSDIDFITHIYEVKLTDMSWSSGAPNLRYGLFNRWRNERIMALEMLQQELNN